MKFLLAIPVFVLSTSFVSSTIDGLSYMDPLIQRSLTPYSRGEDQCNPLYWYPRHIPDYCYNSFKPKPIPLPLSPPALPPALISPHAPPPMIPVPYPLPPLIPYPPPPPIPIYPSTAPQFIPPHSPQYLPPYGPAPMLPIASPPGMVPEMQVGIQPGIAGMVSQDGGINILPFSDAYSDMLEKHKQKVIRKRLQKVLDDYDDFPRKRRYRKYRRGKYY